MLLRGMLVLVVLMEILVKDQVGMELVVEEAEHDLVVLMLVINLKLQQQLK